MIWYIPTDTKTIDGRAAPYNKIVPGDIIALMAGERIPIDIKNIAGTIRNPITITNSNGQVIFNKPDVTKDWYAFWLRNCQYVHLSGAGDNHYFYGIVVISSNKNGVIFQNKTDNLEIDHIQFNEIINGIAIQGQTVATTTADYDYNNDGVVDDADIVNRSNYTQKNINIHDCMIDGGLGLNRIDMGIYIGNSNWYEEPTQPTMIGCNISNVIIQNTSSKSLQCGSVVSGLSVHDNTIINGSQENDLIYGMGGINVNPGCNGSIYNNRIVDVLGHGIIYRGNGGKIYNNTIIRCGRTGTYFNAGISVQLPDGYTHNRTTSISGNTVMSPVGNCIEFGPGVNGTNYIQNNLLINPGDQYLSYYKAEVSNNFLIPA